MDKIPDSLPRTKVSVSGPYRLADYVVSLNAMDGLFLYSRPAVHRGELVFEHDIGYLREHLRRSDVRLVAGTIAALAAPEERAVLSFYPDWRPWKQLSKDGWTTLCERRRRWGVRPWTLGWANSLAKFEEVYEYAWNTSYNNAVVALIVPISDDGTRIAAAEAAGTLNRADLKELLSLGSSVVTRFPDGLVVTIASRRVDEEDVLNILRNVASANVEIAVTPGGLPPPPYLERLPRWWRNRLGE